MNFCVYAAFAPRNSNNFSVKISAIPALFLGLKMTGFDLRLWRKSLGWSRDRAADELGVCLRSYKDYENAAEVKRAIELATITLSVQGLMPLMARPQVTKSKALDMLQRILP